MQLGKVLFPTDYSRTGDLAFELAVSVAEHTRAELMIVHAEEPPRDYGGKHYHGIFNPTEGDLRRQLEMLVPRDINVRCSRHLLLGKPAEAISHCACENDVDLIVMGTHGCTGLATLLVGSVAREVIENACCPVLAVKTVLDEDLYDEASGPSDLTPVGHKQLLETLEGLVEACVDSARGLQQAADDVGHEALKILLSNRAEQRRDFAEELQTEAALRGAVPERRGSLLGKVFRKWIRLSKALGDDASVLNACLKEEEYTFREYHDALQLGLPDEVRETLERHREEIRLLNRGLIGIKDAGVLELNV